MIISAGVLITDDVSILIGHVTGCNYWDIPKGHVDRGECYTEAAVRELKEETGILLNPNQIKKLGRFRYRKGKELVIFFHIPTKFPKISEMKCTSYFSNCPKNVEIDDFKYVKISDLNKFVKPNLLRVIEKALKIKNKYVN